jgi:hypothetical protein
MDGLLANLFDTVAQKFYNKNYQLLEHKEKQNIRKIWTDKGEFHKHFSCAEELFENLKPFGKNGEITNTIVETVVDLFGKYSIISHPTQVDRNGCISGKIKWIKKFLKHEPEEIHFPHNKSDYAKNGDVKNILIDDWLPYIQGWQNNGGYAIRMRTDTFSSKDEVRKFLITELQKLNI